MNASALVAKLIAILLVGTFVGGGSAVALQWIWPKPSVPLVHDTCLQIDGSGKILGPCIDETRGTCYKMDLRGNLLGPCD